MNLCVVVVDDEPSILEVATRYFDHAGFTVYTASDGMSGLNLARETHPDLVVLDVMLPGLDGWRVLEALRAESGVPVLMLTAKGEETDRLRGFESGADDYLVKPFSPRELVARARAILRRGQPVGERTSFGALEVEFADRRAHLAGEELALTPIEFGLLALLARHTGRLWSREDLLGRVWGVNFSGVDRVVDVHISSLRRKLGEAGGLIQTVRGEGYRFLEPPQAAL
jgi:DNA-binding response OmpR family regulator